MYSLCVCWDPLKYLLSWVWQTRFFNTAYSMQPSTCLNKHEKSAPLCTLYNRSERHCLPLFNGCVLLLLYPVAGIYAVWHLLQPRSTAWAWIFLIRKLTWSRDFLSEQKNEGTVCSASIPLRKNYKSKKDTNANKRKNGIGLERNMEYSWPVCIPNL